MPTDLTALQAKLKAIKGNDQPEVRTNSQTIVAIVEGNNKPVKKGKRGQPTKMTPDNLRRIEEVAALGGNIEDMATYCDVHQDTIYNYFKEHQEYSERIERLRGKPILKALNTSVSALGEVGAAHWYLERKRPKEYSTKVEVELTAKVLQIDI